MIDALVNIGLQRCKVGRDQWPRAQAQLRQAMLGFRRAGAPAVTLKTCERFELWTTFDRFRGAGWQDGAAPAFSRVRYGRSALTHLLRVAAGLESRIVGEDEILGQLRRAYRSAQEVGTLNVTLRQLFQSALRIGRRVRRETELGTLGESYARLAVAALTSWPCGGRSPLRVGVLGTGALARGVIQLLPAAMYARLIVFSGHPENARARLGGALAGDPRPIACLRSLLPDLDAIVSATQTKRALLTGADLATRQRPLLIVDLGIPATIDQRVRHRSFVELQTLDQLEPETRPAAQAIAAAEAIVAREVDLLIRRSEKGAALRHREAS